MQQQVLFDNGIENSRASRSGSFVNNMRLPIHRWFRYSAGFSAVWAAQVIKEHLRSTPIRVLDPFVGSGTVMVEGERLGIEGTGIEAHPFIIRIAQAKLSWRENIDSFRELAKSILAHARLLDGIPVDLPALVTKCFPSDSLEKLIALREAVRIHAEDSDRFRLCWLALVAILRKCSPVGTAQWQYILPNKSKASADEPFLAFEGQVDLMSADIRKRQFESPGPRGLILNSDARTCAGLESDSVDLVITSPPYANNYDYADATRLEMSFFGEIGGWGDLQASVRQHLVRSCTQHVAPFAKNAAALLESRELEPIADEIQNVCQDLETVKESHGGKKQYDSMIAHYFFDLAQVWNSLRRVVRTGGRVCFVIGDSAPYGVYVPVDRWLGKLAMAAGFLGVQFEKLRDRNTKWKNRKHRVLLHEGRLWVEG